MDLLTPTTQSYLQSFASFIAQFQAWGKEIFLALLVFNIVWLALWYAFDKASIAESFSDFIKRFFVMTFFFTLMSHPEWLLSITASFVSMGDSLTHAPVDPSSIIEQGIGIANQIIHPVKNSSLLEGGFSLILLSFIYIFVLFIFINIALELALTLIMTTALICLSTFFLGFAALGATSSIARQTLDVILANSVKLLGIYIVVAAASKTLVSITAGIPTNIQQLEQTGFDPYVWIVAATALFWLLSKNLPNQCAKIVSGSFQEHHGHSLAALATAATKILPALSPITNAIKNIGGVASAGAMNLGANIHKGMKESGVMGIAKGTLQSAKDMGAAMKNSVSDNFKHISDKLAGGYGIKEKDGQGRSMPLPGVSGHLNQQTKNVRAMRKNL